MRLLTILLLLPVSLAGQSYVFSGDSPMYQEFIDRKFPFFEATLDLRGIAPKGNDDNLIPRGIFIPLENDVFVCFDTELLRMAAIWQGDFTTLEGVAIKSYAKPFNKKGGGQDALPTPLGQVTAATGLYPGWHKQGWIQYRDPRQRWLSEEELGRGPLLESYGQWLGTEDAGHTAILHYTLLGGTVQENFRLDTIDGQLAVVRSIRLEGIKEPVSLIINDLGEGATDRYTVKNYDCGDGICQDAIVYPISGGASPANRATVFDFSSAEKTEPHWPESIATEFALGERQGPYAVDELRLPYPNPWERRIRPYAIDFFPNGDAVIVTYDGDVYRISNMGKDDSAVIWKKIAAGFNEPNSIRIRGEDIFVFSRLGISQLVDKEGDGETNFYKMFCNRFVQSAEPRDYPLSLSRWEDGQWIISKGGQQSDYPAPHSGRAMKISANGKEVDFWAYGFRNGFMNSIPEKGLLVASDQQGTWVPSTPFFVVREGTFYGFEPGGPFQAAEVQPAALWFPNHIAQSGIDPFWGSDPRLGGLYASILYIDYAKPSLLKIIVPDDDELIQAAGVLLDIDFEVPLLKGAISPADGMAYMVGFQIWDSFAKRIEGLCRLRVLEKTDRYPTKAQVFKEGVLIGFSQKLDEKVAVDPANYQVSSWEYLRQNTYGSAQYKADGSPGSDSRHVHSVLLSQDEQSVFIAIEKMTKTMQLEVQHHLFGQWKGVYFTINELPGVSLAKEGFQSVDFAKLFASEPTPRTESQKEAIISVARGEEVATLYGCIVCHSWDGTTEGKTGPTWGGTWGQKRTLPDGSVVRAEADYLRESILEPEKFKMEAYNGKDAGMPSYKGVLSDADIESVIVFIQSLQKI